MRKERRKNRERGREEYSIRYNNIIYNSNNIIYNNSNNIIYNNSNNIIYTYINT